MENKKEKKYPNLCLYVLFGLLISFFSYVLLSETNKILEITSSSLFDFISIAVIILSLVSIVATIVVSRLGFFSKYQDQEEILYNFRKFLRVVIWMIIGFLTSSVFLIFFPEENIRIENFRYLVLFTLIFFLSFFIYFFTAVFSFIDHYNVPGKNSKREKKMKKIKNKKVKK